MGEPIAEHGKLIGLCAWNGSEWVKIAADSNDYLKVALAASIGWFTVQQMFPENLCTAQYQFDGANWHKSNLLWGYNDIWDEDLTADAEQASHVVTTGTIPAGELWVLQTVSVANADHGSSAAYIWIERASGATLHLAYKSDPPVWQPVLFIGEFVLRAGDVIHIQITGVTIGDEIRAGILGYKMDITM